MNITPSLLFGGNSFNNFENLFVLDITTDYQTNVPSVAKFRICEKFFVETQLLRN